MACDSGMTGVVSCVPAISGFRGTTATRTSSCAMNGQRSGSAIEPSPRTAHALLFFGSADLGLTTVAHGRFTQTPTPAMRDALRVYAATAGMIFGDVPPLDAVLASIEALERRVNG